MALDLEALLRAKQVLDAIAPWPHELGLFKVPMDVWADLQTQATTYESLAYRGYHQSEALPLFGTDVVIDHSLPAGVFRALTRDGRILLKDSREGTAALATRTPVVTMSPSPVRLKSLPYVAPAHPNPLMALWRRVRRSR